MPPLDTNVSPEQAAARAEAMKRIEAFGAVQTQTTPSAPADVPPVLAPTGAVPPKPSSTEPAIIEPIITPQLAPHPAKTEAKTAAIESGSPVVAPGAPPEVAAMAAELQAEPDETNPGATTVLTDKTLPPIAKGNTPLPDELSLVNRLSDRIFDPKVSPYLKIAIGFGVIIFIYILLRVL